jgi:aspartyl-tRNA(Asn)/glutamyl-tRNA(Gln) amidotransferase subunit B
VSKLRTILRYLGTCDGNMEQGSLRADVNVSVRRPGEEFGTRCEIKNVNSIRFIGQAIEYEARRQIEILEDGGAIEQETRLFDAKTGETRSMRSKEEAHDYRYFPDPDLLPLELTQDYVDALAAGLPELPDEKIERFITDYGGLTRYDASVLVAEWETADHFEKEYVEAKKIDPRVEPKAVANWVINEELAYANAYNVSLPELGVPTATSGIIIASTASGEISRSQAKTLFKYVIESDDRTKDPRVIMEEHGIKQITDKGAIEKAVDEVIAANPDKVEQAKQKPKMIGWFVGQVMKATGGKASPQAVNELLREKLGVE